VSGVRILGIGSPSGDDQAGWLTVDALLDLGIRSADGILIEKLDRPGAALIPLLEHAAWVILVDAMQSEGKIGRVRRFDQTNWPSYRHGLSSHGLGVLDALSLAHELGALPPRLELYGIEIGLARTMNEMDGLVLAAVQQLARQIADDLSEMTRT
jgi:hydrogenase maturation protease